MGVAGGRRRQVGTPGNQLRVARSSILDPCRRICLSLKIYGMRLTTLHEDLGNVKAAIVGADRRIARKREEVLGKVNRWWDDVNVRFSAPGAYESSRDAFARDDEGRRFEQTLARLDEKSRNRLIKLQSDLNSAMKFRQEDEANRIRKEMEAITGHIGASR